MSKYHFDNDNLNMNMQFPFLISPLLKGAGVGLSLQFSAFLELKSNCFLLLFSFVCVHMTETCEGFYLGWGKEYVANFPQLSRATLLFSSMNGEHTC